MTTTSATSSTTATSAGSSILNTLNAGSGIDTSSLVEQLVTAQFDYKNTTLSTKSDTIQTQISTVSSIKSAVTAFDSALKSLITGGTLQTQPTSSNTGIVNATAIAGSSVGSLASSVEVRQLASAQVASTGVIADASTSVGTGKLTLTFGNATVTDGAMTGFTAGSGTPIDITITSDNSSLQGVADAINGKNAGVTASVLTDSDGSRLVLKSATGAAQAFTLTATEDSSAPGLSALNVGVDASGTSITSAAQDAVVAVDGVAVKRSTNSISDLIPGVKLDLVSASPGTKVSLGTTAPTAALSQAVSDFVDAYNQLQSMLTTATDPTTGPLRSDTATKTLIRKLSQMTVTNMNPGAAAGQPTTLAALGVSTNKDGSLSLDTSKLASVLKTNGSAVEAMFKDGAGVSQALSDIADEASNTTYGLGASAATYQAAATQVATDQQKASDDADTLRTRLTQQFSTMNTMVASYKSTQSFLTQQIDAWNSSSN